MKKIFVCLIAILAFTNSNVFASVSNTSSIDVLSETDDNKENEEIIKKIEFIEKQISILNMSLANTPLSETGKRNSLRKQISELEKQVTELKKMLK